MSLKLFVLPFSLGAWIASLSLILVDYFILGTFTPALIIWGLLNFIV